MAYTTIDDPSAHFQVATWTGTASTKTVTNDGNSDLIQRPTSSITLYEISG